MDMNSFVVSIGKFFLMSRENESNFDQDCRKYIIPKYQREYKWTSERVKTLISDINNRDKFLGNLILNKKMDYYEIVDGQQRITTIMLILIALFNKNRPNVGINLSEEQREILLYICENNCPVLENESVGVYIQQNENIITFSINDESDIYYQKNTFTELYSTIEEELNNLWDIMSFQKKVLDCQILVLIGETHGRQNDSIEEVFLDINFKSQLLDVADIFKGYCFKNYAINHHDELKTQWTEVRKYMKKFEKIGYNDKETCEYLYHYLLSCPDTYQIPANLSFKGKHYLEGKNNTFTKQLLLDMLSYGKHITEFIDSLSINSYKFNDICFDMSSYRADSDDVTMLKQILEIIIKNTKVQYYKFPFFMFIHFLRKNNTLKMALSCANLKKFVANYYAYSFFFVNYSGNKNKTTIDQTIFDELNKLNSGESASNVVQRILEATKVLRKKYSDNYKQFTKFAIDKAQALYSLMDNYNANDNNLMLFYNLSKYNKEHLLLHDNRNFNVTWEEENDRIVFNLKDILGQSDASTYRALTANYLILPRELNENIGQKDIVEKIVAIKEYYLRRNLGTPKHITIFLSHIDNMATYTTLKQMKGLEKTRDEIENAYKSFIIEYFSEEKQHILYEKLENSLRETFQN